MAAVVTNGVQWAVAARSCNEGEPSGDLHVVVPVRQGVLVAVIDGIGHGEEAAAAARAAARCFEQNAGRAHILTLAADCHEALRGTRGAVASIAFFNRESRVLIWLGVGNVECVRFPAGAAAPDRLLLRPGILGHTLPPLRAEALPLATGDTVLFATDGIRSDFELAYAAGDAPESIVERVMMHARKEQDDALALAARYAGRP